MGQADIGDLFLEFKLPPQLLKPCGIGSGVANGVLNVAVPEIALNQAGVRTLIGKSKGAGMAQHVGMDGHRELGFLAEFAQGEAYAVERCRGFRCSLRKNVRSGAFMRVRSTSQALMARISSPLSGWVVESPPLEAGDVEDAALDVRLLQHQAAGLGEPEPMPKHQQD